MHGVVSMLDEHTTKTVQNLWTDLANDFGVCQVSKFIPCPHVSYQIAQEYQESELVRCLEDFASQATPFQIQTTGLAQFTGTHLVLYVPIVRTLELSTFHQNLWQAITSMGSGISPYYQPANWVPHITLAEGDIDPKKLADILAYLSSHPLRWDILIDNLAIIWRAGTAQEPRYEPRYQFPFQQRGK